MDLQHLLIWFEKLLLLCFDLVKELVTKKNFGSMVWKLVRGPAEKVKLIQINFLHIWIVGNETLDDQAPNLGNSSLHLKKKFPQKSQAIKLQIKNNSLYFSHHAIIMPLSVQSLGGGQFSDNPFASVTICKTFMMYSLLATPPETTWDEARNTCE